MELIDRYLHAVRIWLPADKREDILAELSEDLASQIEERSGALGRPLNQDEIAALLKQRGHPRVVACHYLPHQHLIGPAFYPIYRLVLRMALLWILPAVFLVIVGPLAALTSDQPGIALVHALMGFPQAALICLVVITAVFALLEKYHAAGHSIDCWDPLTLPAVPPEARNQMASALGSVIEMAVGLLAASCWAWLAWSGPTWNLGATQIALAPIWHTLSWPILLLLAGGAFGSYFTLLQPSRWRLRSGIHLASSAGALVLTYILERADLLLQITSPNPADALRANHALRIGLLWIGAVILVQIAVDLWRLVRRPAHPVAAAATNHA
jgi:hypothetical protein